MTEPPAPLDWSPADSPAAIAVSESTWWFQSVRLTIHRLRGEDDRRVRFSSRQMDARFLVFALRQLITTQQLMLEAVRDAGVSDEVSTALSTARLRFEDALPGIKHMRDALMHFEDWSRGNGRGPQRDRYAAGESRRDIAQSFWFFAFDPVAATVSLGPYAIALAAADQAVAELRHAIYVAGHEIDRASVASRPEPNPKPSA